jgi:hypothetical protein
VSLDVVETGCCPAGRAWPHAITTIKQMQLTIIVRDIWHVLQQPTLKGNLRHLLSCTTEPPFSG